MKTIRPVRRQRGPVISWAPSHDSYYIVASMLRGTASTPPLHVTQSALLAVEGELAAGKSPVPFGLLAGKFCVCPETRIDYLLIDEVSPAAATLSSEDPAAQLATELRAQIADATRRRKLVLGWYIGGMDDDLQLDQDVIGVHRQLFADPWNIVLVRNDGAGIQQGAFLRYQPMTAQMYAIPFFELDPPASRGAEGAAARTAVRWANYRAREAVLPLDSPPPETSRALRPAEKGRTKASLSEWFERLRGAGKPTGASSDSPSSSSAERATRADAPTPPVAPVVSSPARSESPVRREPTTPAAPIIQAAADAKYAVQVQVVPERQSHVTPSVDPVANNLPAAPVRVTFPALLPDTLLDDEEPVPPERRWLVPSLGMIGLLVACCLAWLLWHR